MTRARLDLVSGLLVVLVALAQAAEPVQLGSRLELMVDGHLIERLSGAAQLRLRFTLRDADIYALRFR